LQNTHIVHQDNFLKYDLYLLHEIFECSITIKSLFLQENIIIENS